MTRLAKLVSICVPNRTAAARGEIAFRYALTVKRAPAVPNSKSPRLIRWLNTGTILRRKRYSMYMTAKRLTVMAAQLKHDNKMGKRTFDSKTHKPRFSTVVRIRHKPKKKASSS